MYNPEKKTKKNKISEGDTGTRAMVAALAREEHEMWRRVNLAEEEDGKAADEKGMARLRRLKNL